MQPARVAFATTQLCPRSPIPSHDSQKGYRDNAFTVTGVDAVF
jgi:hypothetical protein